MSEENVEIVRGGYEAFDRGDMPSWLSRFDPEVVIHENADFPDSLICRGHAGALQWVESVNELWDDARLDPQTFRSGGEFVVVSCRAHWARPRERHPGGRADSPGIPLCGTARSWRPGRTTTRHEALEAAGLSE